MVGNAEPGKEYNYRPLSKLCECQLDVNDQVSTKGLGEGGLGEERRADANSSYGKLLRSLTAERRWRLWLKRETVVRGGIFYFLF